MLASKETRSNMLESWLLHLYVHRLALHRCFLVCHCFLINGARFKLL